MPLDVLPVAASLPKKILTGAAVVAALGAACVAYGAYVERRWYRRSRYRIPVLPHGAAPLSVLHLSDLHFRAGDRHKASFLGSLERPDVVVVTGDFLGEPQAVEDAVAAVRPLRGHRASYFVLGSNDYYAPRWLNYFAYFSWREKHRAAARSRPDDLVEQLQADGWTYLKNRKTSLSLDGLRLELVGLDDPHIERHDLRAAPRRDPGALGLAVVHSPDPAPELAAFGYEVILSGHTHGGQVRLPVVGALVSNCTIPNRLAMGLSRVGHSYLHVSPGMGTSKYAPFRFLCRPEATVLDLVAAQHSSPVKDRVAAGAAGLDPPVHLGSGR
jgi:predicted MPP superfamily phosphohydrolase